MHKKLFESDTQWNVIIRQITEQISAKLPPNAFILLVYGLDKKKKVAKISLDGQILRFIWPMSRNKALHIKNKAAGSSSYETYY